LLLADFVTVQVAALAVALPKIKIASKPMINACKFFIIILLIYCAVFAASFTNAFGLRKTYRARKIIFVNFRNRKMPVNRDRHFSISRSRTVCGKPVEFFSAT
jgi:hypothetical protein